MSESILERRLMDVSQRVKRMRGELSVAEEQLAFLQEEAEDARLRALVSETPLGEAEARESQKHADAMARQRDALARSIAALLVEQDDLLDRMAAELTNR